ncbi:MAG: hypothetical protein NW217_05825 [Hyphomicrobiaceae bacterium]|nr:hypothetical protein [Hyphomicrobiaceae bacterium]
MSFLDTRLIGEATLILIGAIVLGYVVSRIWPKSANPQLFGTLAAFALVGALSYMGVAGAGVALAVLVALLVLFGIAAVAL